MLIDEWKLPVSRACQVMKLSRAAYYRGVTDQELRDRPVIEALNALVGVHLRWGFWKCFDRLRLDGHSWNHKRVYRIYCAMRLNLPRRIKRRVPRRERQPLAVAQQMNQVWAMDFMSDTLYDGRRLRTLNVIDEANRGGLGIEVATSIPTQRVIRVLDQLIQLHGCPQAIRCDNGPEFTSQALAQWCGRRGIEIRFIQPGKPDQNAYVERFNRSYREEILSAYLFDSLVQVQEITDSWLVSYNEQRPHDALGSLPPAMYRTQVLEAKKSSCTALST